MFELSYGSPRLFRTSSKTGMGLNLANYRKVHSRLKVATYLPWNIVLTYHELSDRTVYQPISVAGQGFSNIWKSSSSTLPATVSPSSTLQGHFDLHGIAEADSTYIKELPGFRDGRIDFGMSLDTETPGLIPSTGRRSSHHFDLDTSMELRSVGTTTDRKNPSEPVYLLPVSSRPSFSRPLKIRGSMCPIIQTDVHQRQEKLILDTLQCSSPDTATTNTSGETFSTYSGYDSAAPDCYQSAGTSPGSFYARGKQSIFNAPIWDFTECLEQDIHPQSIRMSNFIEEKLLEPSAAQGEFDFPLVAQDMQTSCFAEPQEKSFHFIDAGAGYSLFDARTAQIITDMGNGSPCDNMNTGKQSQSFGSTFQPNGNRCLDVNIPRADQGAKHGAVAFSQFQNTEVQSSLDTFPYWKTDDASTSPWSAENIRGFDRNFDFSTLPANQLLVGEIATTSTHENSSPNSEYESIKCTHPDCLYESGGEYQWKRGNLRRYIKEKHELNIEDRLLCDIGYCKATFTRIGNLHAHKENKQNITIPRQKRKRRNTMDGNTKRPRAGSRIMKATKRFTGSLVNFPNHSQPQLGFGSLNINES
ncbi:hypothetical protein SBOR_1179 [Sclerotinia borealis F-4128]|uniref:Uncharacterized protein n=1 Tax=Sclerotinia borealis (strain F-4128) TaxID=1432307 RepID=W9CNX7_SCLBF|nr:hypothetical protein SBOR_1179 [Sclerotinia borealis F-4128]